MKAKLLLCMMVLAMLSAMAQPRVTDNGYIQMPTPFPVLTKTIESKASVTQTPKRANKAKAGAVEHQVDFVLDFATDCQRANQILLVNHENTISNYDQGIFMLENGTTSLSVPEGTYDIFVSFSQVDDAQEVSILRNLYVIREQVAIDQDMQLNFAASEAKNHIHFETLTPDGEPINMGKWSVDEDYSNWIELEPANTHFFQYIKNIYCNDYGWILMIHGNLEVTIEEGPHIRTGHEFIGDFFVNDVSDRYTFYTYQLGFKDHEVFTTVHEIQGAFDNVTLTNDPSNYVLFQDPMIAQKHQNEELFPSYIFYNQLLYDEDLAYYTITLTTPLAKDEVCKFYLSASIDDSQVGFMPFLEPSVGQILTETSPWGFVQQQYVPALACMRLTNTNGEAVFANNGVGATLTKARTASLPPSFEYEWTELLERVVRYPLYSAFNPSFSYSVEKKKEDLANNCPVIVVSAGLLNFEGGRELFAQRDYIGRYGEKRTDDAGDALVEVYNDGEIVFSGSGFIGLGPDDLTSGEVDIIITNKNDAVTVDDLPCCNKAQMHFTIGSDDQFTPTTTMLHFKDNNDDVTDRFATAERATFDFCAGDFNALLTSEFQLTYDRYAPESVEVSYSPYGEDNWNELAVEEVPENYWPVMGWFYTGSLAGVTGEGLNGWFDLKIRLTDAAGNWQEQVLSPAFRIDDHAYSSVATITPSNKGDNTIYNLAGQRMRGDLESLPHGIYIVGGKKVVK